jgi:long-chain acyl-CoA synthetase
LKDTIRVVEEEKEVTKVIDGKEVTKKLWNLKYFQLGDYKYLSSKKPFLRFLELLLIWVSRKTNVFNAYAQTRYATLAVLLHGL